MKYRASGMPDESLWTSFFNSEQILKQLDVGKQVNTLIDIGCGYGTFLIPAARLIKGTAIGVDIAQQMIESCKKKANEQHLKNIVLLNGDIVSPKVVDALENYKGTIDYVTLFNILHCEQPVKLLSRVSHILNRHGKVGVIHWINEDTPRGPSMDIRPTPDKINEWASQAGLSQKKYVKLPPYHFGLLFTKD